MVLRRLIVEVPVREEDEVKRLLMKLTSEVRGESLVVSGDGRVKSLGAMISTALIFASPAAEEA